MKIRSIVLILALIYGITIQAAPTDSVGVKEMNGKTYVMHKVTSGETLSKLSRKYAVTIAEIKGSNPGFTILKAGETILVPRKYSLNRSIGSTNDNATINRSVDNESVINVAHTVKAGETLYKISQKYGVKVEDIKSANQLSSNDLKVGQVLQIPNSTTLPQNKPQDTVKVQVNNGSNKKDDKDTAPVNNQEETNPVVATTSNTIEEVTSVLKENLEAHLANAQEAKDLKLEQNRMWVAHPTAKVGTLFEMVNPATGRIAYARVIGNYSKGAYGQAGVIITQAVAEMLNSQQENLKVQIIYTK